MLFKQQVTKKLKELEREVLANRLSKGSGYGISRNQTGTVIKFDGLTAQSTKKDFALGTKIDTSAGTTYYVTVKFGIVNAYQFASTTVKPWPAEFTTSADYELEVSTSGIRIVYIKVTVDSNYKVSAIALGEGSVLPSNTATDGYLAIGAYDLNTTAGTLKIISGNLGLGNLYYNYCGGQHFFASFNGGL